MDTNTQTTETPATGSQPSKPAKPARKPAAKRTSKAPAKTAAAAKPKSSAKLVSKPSSTTDGTPLKTLLAKLKLPADGRAARRKLRAAGFSWHDKRTRWNLSAKQYAQAETVLRGGE